MVRELLNNAASKLGKSETPILDARVLLAAAMGRENAALIFEPPTNEQLAIFNKYIEKWCPS